MSQEQNIPSIKAEHTSALGRQIIEWIRTEASLRPRTVEEVNVQLKKIDITITFPTDQFDGASPVTMITTSLNEWVVRLPPIELIEQSLEQIRTGNYPVSKLPTYFRAYPDSGKRYDEDFLFARLADFTVTQCG